VQSGAEIGEVWFMGWDVLGVHEADSLLEALDLGDKECEGLIR
jgi:hypothetical protein